MRKNGFTLIELLAVIVIVGLIALLIVPKVKDTISDSKKNAYEISANSLVRIATNYYLEKRANKSFVRCSYNFNDMVSSCEGLEFMGDSPDSGKLEIRDDGKVIMAVQFGNFCFKKNYDDDTLQIMDYDNNTCDIIE